LWGMGTPTNYTITMTGEEFMFEGHSIHPEYSNLNPAAPPLWVVTSEGDRVYSSMRLASCFAAIAEVVSDNDDTIPTCPICSLPAHAGETDDLDRHPACVNA